MKTSKAIKNLIKISDIKNDTAMIALYKDKALNGEIFFNMVLSKFDRNCFNAEDNTYHIISNKIDIIVPIEQCVFALPSDKSFMELSARAWELEAKLHDTLNNDLNKKQTPLKTYSTMNQLRDELLKLHSSPYLTKYAEDLKKIYTDAAYLYPDTEENQEEIAELDRITNNK